MKTASLGATQRSVAAVGVCQISRLIAAIVMVAAGVSAQDSFVERFNLHGTDESTDIQQERMVSPTQRDERELSDDISRNESRMRRSDSDFDLSSFTADYAEPLSEVEEFTSFRRQAERQDETIDVGEAEPSEPFEPEGISGDIFSELSVVPELSPAAVFSDAPSQYSRCEQWQILPAGLLYHSYLAGEKEPRTRFMHLYDTRNKQTYWEADFGGRMGLLRYGTVGVNNPEGFQLDAEAAVFARVFPNEPSTQLVGSDYRLGMVATWRRDGTAYKAGAYHISSHVGDEYLLANPLFTRINYVRDSLVAGTVHELNSSSKIYGEIGYAIGTEGGARPLELQFGAEYAPMAIGTVRGAPFTAVNGHLREDFDFRGGVNVVSGWSWQGVETRHRFRVAMQYYHGPSLQYEFFDRWENLIGGGLWMDY